MSSEVACQAVALREGLETSLFVSVGDRFRNDQRFLDFARNDMLRWPVRDSSLAFVPAVAELRRGRQLRSE